MAITDAKDGHLLLHRRSQPGCSLLAPGLPCGYHGRRARHDNASPLTGAARRFLLGDINHHSVPTALQPVAEPLLKVTKSLLDTGVGRPGLQNDDLGHLLPSFAGNPCNVSWGSGSSDRKARGIVPI